MEFFLVIVGAIIFWLWRSTSEELDTVKAKLAQEEELNRQIDNAQWYCKHQRREGDNYYNQRVAETEKACEQRLAQTKRDCNQRVAELNRREEYVERFIQAKVREFPEVATVIADLDAAHDEARARQLEKKLRPALKGAETVREVKAEKRAIKKQLKGLEWELRYIRRLLPWLDEIEDSPPEPVIPEYFNPDYNPQNDEGDEVDNAGYWLTPDEYRSLSTVEKNQRALDRYNKRKKTNAEIGRDYERYIGYLFEQDGFKVDYTGIKDGLNDLGRDLICTKSRVTYVVQCKCWSNKRSLVIREKHIAQIFGTTFKYYLELRKTRPVALVFGRKDDLFSHQVIPMFVSTVPLSDTAAEFVAELGIEFRQQPFGKYPVIKCNVNNKGEKIYHLPFDQMYDKTDVSNPGEFYAMTVAEAEAAGFRRAKRWKGSLSEVNRGA